ncbi:hypothetical protein BB559_002724 [Furculomyces boomerangus]|uniref:Uncharacterized protein n=2 Tax=Harpellales TaxID=61421 RepID=A0A2T9YSW3_9FUNG|nr:hypothetical protein BB559_002724 [Furculomyces boomerangus]PWA02723.1 hypothetical protein BB558_001136 [Smittium angustum]
MKKIIDNQGDWKRLSPAEMMFGVPLVMPHEWKPPAEIDNVEESILERVGKINLYKEDIRGLGLRNIFSA